MQSAISP
jgi:hypothetical protein